MNDTGLRRSARIRKQINSCFASAQDQQATEASGPTHTLDYRHGCQHKSSDGEYVAASHLLHARSAKQNEASSMQCQSCPTNGTPTLWGQDRMRKQPKTYTVSANKKVSVKQSIIKSSDRPGDSDRSAKRTKHSEKGNADSAQLYGHPSEGTMVRWGESRVRKQPKIYPVVQRSRPPLKMAEDDRWMASAAANKIARQKKSIRKLKPGEAETRLRSYMGKPPVWYNGNLERAKKEKMFVLERTRGIEEDCHARRKDCPFEILAIAGQGGNVYTVTISHLTSCTCPVGIFSSKADPKQCKHILYILHHVLKAPDHLKYQPAFLTSELKELFANAPPLPTDVLKEEPEDGKRKSVEGDCPICFMDFNDDESIVWCKAACGNNIHKGCFDQWAKSKTPVTCPLCRSKWQFEMDVTQGTKLAGVQMPTEGGAGGYLNVYDQLQHVI